MDHTIYKKLSDYLSKGIYPDNLDKTEKRSIRSQANPFYMKDLLMYLSTLPEDNTAKEAFWVKDYQLRDADRDIILNGEWLNDKHIDAAQKLVCQYLGDKEMQTVLMSQADFKPVTGETVQLLHNGNNHWLCSAYIGGKVMVADSLNIVLTSQVSKQLRELYKGQIHLTDISLLDN